MTKKMYKGKDRMSVFRFLQVRKYPYLPSDLLYSLSQWFVSQRFRVAIGEIREEKKKPGKDTSVSKGPKWNGSMKGSKEGVHLNFVPKFAIDVQAVEGGYFVTLHYYARIRKVGIAAALLSQGITAVVGAATLAVHVDSARDFTRSVWDMIDGFAQGPFEVVFLQGPEPADNFESTTTTTWLQNVPAHLAPIVVPAAGANTTNHHYHSTNNHYHPNSNSNSNNNNSSPLYSSPSWPSSNDGSTSRDGRKVSFSSDPVSLSKDSRKGSLIDVGDLSDLSLSKDTRSNSLSYGNGMSSPASSNPFSSGSNPFANDYANQGLFGSNGQNGQDWMQNAWNAPAQQSSSGFSAGNPFLDMNDAVPPPVPARPHNAGANNNNSNGGLLIDFLDTNTSSANALGNDPYALFPSSSASSSSSSANPWLSSSVTPLAPPPAATSTRRGSNMGSLIDLTFGDDSSSSSGFNSQGMSTGNKSFGANGTGLDAQGSAVGGVKTFPTGSYMQQSAVPAGAAQSSLNARGGLGYGYTFDHLTAAELKRR